jgi:hypothetical protein
VKIAIRYTQSDLIVRKEAEAGLQSLPIAESNMWHPHRTQDPQHIRKHVDMANIVERLFKNPLTSLGRLRRNPGRGQDYKSV